VCLMVALQEDVPSLSGNSLPLLFEMTVCIQLRNGLPAPARVNARVCGVAKKIEQLPVFGSEPLNFAPICTVRNNRKLKAFGQETAVHLADAGSMFKFLEDLFDGSLNARIRMLLV